jgi:signal transduction histidine kinase
MPPDISIINRPEFKSAFVTNEQKERITTGKVASVLVAVLMPAGSICDAFVCTSQDNWPKLLALRLMCSLLVGVVFYLHTTAFGRKHYRLLGPPIALLPAFFLICIMCVEEQVRVPYYAALNLIILAISVVVHWSVLESLFTVAGVILMYAAACILHPIPKSMTFNNFYFLVLTGVIVVTGNYFFNRLRFREFAAAWELDQNKKILEENNQKLMELDQIKSRFFANISHELRTPLTLLIAPLENLLQKFKLDDATREMLATMHSNGMRLLKLINDLLDLVRLESGRMEIKPESVHLAEFLKALASAARQVAEDKRLRLETFVDPGLGMVMIDRDKLEKVVLNLVFNALKFTPAGGRVELRAVKSGEDIRLTVADTGMGISEKNLPHVFDRFWQADGSSKRKYQGVGIGLALVKELIEVQGGQVSVQSQEGKGTTFTVQLPCREAPPEVTQSSAGLRGIPVQDEGGTVSSEEWLANLYRRAELFPALTPVRDSLRPAETARNGSMPRVLVADDEPDMLRFLKSQLGTEYQVFEAVDGQQAVEKAGQFLPDLIVLDMMMPEKDGLQACREIRDNTSTHGIPIILLTARADEETKLTALSAGASDFLAKPFSTVELHVRIKNLIKSYQYQRKISKQNQALASTIEQLKETEVELVRSAKMSSLGVVAAGLMHEINNALNFPSTNIFALRKKATHLAPEFQQDYLKALSETDEGIKRVSRLTHELRKFAHPASDNFEQVDVTEAVTSALLFTSHELEKTGIEIQQTLTEHQSVWANKNNLIQVIMNLVLNSKDALRTKAFQNGEKATIWIDSRTAPGKSLIIVRDNGTGIQEQHLDKIFDPFFTTKDVGEGTGLGLSICYRIVQACDGRILVRTEPGKFTEFTLEFPLKGQMAPKAALAT